jgi:hypothetical protein
MLKLLKELIDKIPYERQFVYCVSVTCFVLLYLAVIISELIDLWMK